MDKLLPYRLNENKASKYTQKRLLDVCEANECLPSYSQCVRMRKLAAGDMLGENEIEEIMSEEKANQKDRIVIFTDELKRFYPKGTRPKDITADIFRLLERRERQRERWREDSR